MNLSGYSDSEDSGDDVPPAPKPTQKPAPKPAFQKVVDRSNPGKIKLNLPGLSQPRAEKDDIETDAPPAKKPRIGGGAFSGFNAMLPAPKKPQVNASTEGGSGKRGVGRGLGSGVNLKTGAEPAFKREPRIEMEEYDENGNPVKKEPLKKEDFRALLNLPAPNSGKIVENTPTEASTGVGVQPEPEVKPVSIPKFVPMSVGRGRKKKPTVAKPIVAAAEIKSTPTSTLGLQSSAGETKPPPKPKVSLFSISQDTEGPTTAPSSGDYQPLLYGARDDEEVSIPDESFGDSVYEQPAPVSAPAASTDLNNIASELKLTEAERRQLFGRKGQGPDLSSAKIVEFNTDSEYAHNEMLRQQGETVQHNALKSITGTGKNSLRSLVNVATTQKDALEDHFAQGRRNKKEAGNKYGW